MNQNSLRMIVQLILGAACFAWHASPSQAVSPRQPNVVILLADDLGYADLGFQGGRDIPTPHLDRLARGGVRCTSGYVSGPYCSPTRAGLLTGRYQQRFGHEFNPGAHRRPQSEVGLPITEKTIADRLRSAGYATGLIGKWHLGWAPKFHPRQRGFDEFFGFLGGAHDYFPLAGASIQRDREIVKERDYLTDAIAREAASFIARHKAQPFLLYVAFNAVHTPMHAKDDKLSRFSSIADTPRRTYAGMLSAMDDAVGQVLGALQAHGLDDNTLIIFLSDNGGPTMRSTTINASNNAPLRGSKRTTLEGGIRVPFIVHFKGRLPAGSTYSQPVIQLDVLPTAMAAAGVDIAPDWPLDGRNLLPYLQGVKTEPPHETLYWRLGEQMAVRHGEWKLVRYDLMADGAPAYKVSNAKLYNLATDVGEARDLAAIESSKAKELESIWQAWNRQLPEPLWGPGRRRTDSN